MSRPSRAGLPAGRPPCTRRGRLAAVLLWLIVAMPAAAAAQVDLRAAEREQEVERIELPEISLERHHFVDQQLALWLPEGFALQPVRAKGVRHLLREADHSALAVGRYPVQPGASLIQLMEGVVEGIRGSGGLTEVSSIRQIRLATRPAIEVTGTGQIDGRVGAVRLMLAMDPDSEHFRTVFVHQPGTADGSPDELFLRLLRDWTPLDFLGWGRSFERLRPGLVEAGPSLGWDQRNRLFDAIAKPSGLGQPWVAERLGKLAADGSQWLVDGLVHSHPRVRMASIEALDPAALPEASHVPLIALAARDPDPAVRLRAARWAASVPGVSGEVVDRALEVDSAVARAAALQLLVLMEPAERDDSVAASFRRRSRYPVRSVVLLASLLRRWQPEGAVQELDRVRKTSRDEAVRAAALRELLALGYEEALTVARQRLEAPLDDSPLELPDAARALAVHAPVAEAEALEKLEQSLADVLAGDEASDRDGIEESRQLLGELGEHFAELPAEATADDECPVLVSRRKQTRWVSERVERLGCEREPSAELVRLTLERPGAFVSSLIELLGRLDLGSTPYNETYQAALDVMLDKLRHWEGDPVSMTSTGVDLSAPMRLSWWAGRDDSPEDGPGWGGSTLWARSSDPQSFLDSTLRLAESSIGVRRINQSLMAIHGLPLMPLGLFSAWSEENAARVGESADTADELPGERYVALTSGGATGSAERSTLIVVELNDRETTWSRTRFLQRDDALVVSESDLSADAADAADEDAGPLWASGRGAFEVDLSAFLELFGEVEDEAAAEDSIPDGLVLALDSSFDLPAVATRLRISGQTERWLAAIVNRPAAELRAPAELLPAGSLAWGGLRFDPAGLVDILESESGALIDAVGKRHASKIRSAAGSLLGEVGFALIGVAEAGSEAGGEAWQDQIVAYAAVEPRVADRFLKKALGRPETVDGRRYHRWEEGVVTRIGDFLVVGSSREALAPLFGDAKLAGTAAYQQLLSRSPESVVFFGGFDTDRLADSLRATLAQREDGQLSLFVVEGLSSLGRIASWLRLEDGDLAGELSIAPRVLPADAEVSRLDHPGVSGWTASSIGNDWPPAHAAIPPPYSEVEFVLELPPEAGDAGVPPSDGRLAHQQIEPGVYRFVSRRGAPLPEQTEVRLPIESPELLPYLRNEHNLSLHLGELQELAETIRGEESDPARIVRAIVDWAHESLEYSVIRRSASVEETLATRQADCTEFSQLTIALARSLDIPARPVSGVYLGRGGAILHQWAEVFLDRWYEIDPTFGVVQPPAESVRLPTIYGSFLASAPGSRLTVQSLVGAEGGWTRRVESPEQSAAADVALAVDGERVLIELHEVEGDGIVHLLSRDAGRSFEALPASGLSGGRVELLGGQGSLLRVQRSSAEPPAVVAHELGDGGSWNAIELPEPIPQLAGDLSLSVVSGGYLALVAGAEPRMFEIDAGLSSAVERPLPSSVAGHWSLAAGGGALALAAPEAAVQVFRWEGEGWSAPVALDDTAGLQVDALRRQGDELVIEVTGVESAVGTRGFLVVLGSGGQSKRSLQDDSAARTAEATATDGSRWSVWSDDTAWFLSLRPVAR